MSNSPFLALIISIFKTSVSPSPTKRARVCLVHEDCLTHRVATQETLVDGHTLRLFSLTLSMLYRRPAMQRGIELIKSWVKGSPFIHTSAFFSGRMRPFSVRHVKAGGFWRLSISSETQQKE